MLRQLSRWSIALTFGAFALLLAGCVVDSGTKSSSELTHVKISPDFNLHAAPDGTIYQLWLTSFGLTIDTLIDTLYFEGDSTVIIVRDSASTFLDTTIALTRFQWDPYLYTATDEQGNIIPLASADGLDLGRDIRPLMSPVATVAFITLEPRTDPLPGIPNGPMVVVNNVSSLSFRSTMLNPFNIIPLLSGSLPVASFELLSQSNKKSVPGSRWRDNATEGYGIWFADPVVAQNFVVDSAGRFLTYSQTILPEGEPAYDYVVWISVAHPESSFSNFGHVFDDREPNLLFSDGHPYHSDTTKYGPEGDLRDGDPPPVHLGEDPVVENGVTVGYRYFSYDRSDTCIVRLDNPALTHCSNDTITLRPYGIPDTTVRSFSFSTGDTTINSTLGGVVDLTDLAALDRLQQGISFIFAGYEYEAWLVFTKASGIKPLSLGRFKNPRAVDADNRYTFGGTNFDSNFTFPGEDFLQNLSSHDATLSSPLNVLTDPRVEKIWITLEPELALDWAPDEPNTQLIYLAAFTPKEIRGSVRFPLIFRDLNPSPDGLTDGNSLPVVSLAFLAAPTQQ